MLDWDEAHVMSFDFETSGELPEYALQPWRVAQKKAWPTSLVWMTEEPTHFQPYGGLYPTKRMMREMLTKALDEKRWIVGWNTAFDIAWLIAHGFEEMVMECKWLDGMLIWRHYDIEPEYEADNASQKRSYGLKQFVYDFMPEMAGYEEDIDFHDPDPAVRKKLHKYNIQDNTATLTGARFFFEKLNMQQRRAMLIEAESLPIVAKANLIGQRVDPIQVHWLQTKLVDTRRKAMSTLKADLIESPDYSANLEKLLRKRKPVANPRQKAAEMIISSPAQLGRLMFDVWELPILKTNEGKKTGITTRSTDKEVLHELAFKDDRAKVLRTAREALNLKTKFPDAIERSLDYNEDGCTHPEARIFGTYSGRMTYSSKQGKNKAARQTGYAMHQMKNHPDFRSQIIAPEGYELVEFDAAGQEFRWMAIASGDETMLELCLPGEDAHSFMGAQIAGREYRELMKARKAAEEAIKAIAENDRKAGKVGNLSLQYRTSARKLRTVARVQYNMNVELPEAQRWHKTYARTYQRVPVYWNEQIIKTKRRGYVETFAGRRVRVEGDWNGRMGWSMGSTAINYRIQGTGADQKYLAMMILKDYINEIDAYFGWDLHDGLYYLVPHRHVERACVKMHKLLLDLPYKKAWGFEPPVWLPFDCKRGFAWGSMKEVKLD